MQNLLLLLQYGKYM